MDHLDELKNFDKENIVFDRELSISAKENENYINQLKNSGLGEEIKQEINTPKKVKVDKLYKTKQKIKRFFNLFG